MTWTIVFGAVAIILVCSVGSYLVTTKVYKR